MPGHRLPRVTGSSGREYYRCVAVALRSRFKVDLIDYRSAAPHIRDAIDTEGRVLYAPNP